MPTSPRQRKFATDGSPSSPLKEPYDAASNYRFLICRYPRIHIPRIRSNLGANYVGVGGMGVSIAMTETDIFVGRPGEFPMSPMPPGRAGGVHIFGRETPIWREFGMLTDERVQLGDGFGSAMAAR